MRYLLLLLLLLVTPALAQGDCPECGMMLLNKFQTKFEGGRSWQLYGCVRQHLYWVPSAPAVTPSYGRDPSNCPSCGMYLMYIGTRFTQLGRMVKQFRCTRGHIYEI